MNKDLELKTKGLWELVLAENERQIEKWGIQDHQILEWMLILGEEVGELNKAVLEQWILSGDWRERRKQTVKEAIQVATLALKIAEINL